MLAPIVLFVYNRPFHTKQVLASLAANKEAEDCVLFIYCDGPKKDVTEDALHKIYKTRSIVKQENRFKKIFIIEHPSNKGLADSIIDGVTEIVNQYGKVIVIEDDLILSPFFFVLHERQLNSL